MNFLKSFREFMTPVLTSSHFYKKGVLTPEEFVAAGDLLVSKCPTWHWDAGDSKKKKTYLPDDKQLLITRNVPCKKRATALLQQEDDERALEDGWVDTFVHHVPENSEVVDLDEESKEITLTSSSEHVLDEKVGSEMERRAVDDDDDDDDIPDMEEVGDDEDLLVEEDDACVGSGGAGKEEDGEDSVVSSIVKTRRYDISMTYDKYYQTPRIWLFGYAEDNTLLTPDQILEDIYAEYAKKTVTIEKHPYYSNILAASIHPCHHADVMKKLVDQSSADGKYVRVDLYLFLFLKFISSVIPTMNYDFTVKC
eukprot:TRINITY_DN2208_c0_g1_i1.p1 TRINITY_DN2208_c0_g1~~TRINITY_DN2208_c0_g1_i1.p1  ORF type:complete len:309 (+),score=97.03 TRINITY_DN2208_c0_g1_i1:107-1033(+)